MRKLFRDSVRATSCKAEEESGAELTWRVGRSVPDAVLPVGRQAPQEWRRSSNWPSASIPTAAAAGHPIRRRPNRTNVLSLQWKRPSWCRRGATDYRLTCRSPLQNFPLPHFRRASANVSFPSSCSSGAGPAITLYSVHVLPAAHNKAILSSRTPPAPSSSSPSRQRFIEFSEATDRLSLLRAWQVVIVKRHGGNWS